MTRKEELKQEAAAWRKLAEWCDGNPRANEGLCYILRWNPPCAIKCGQDAMNVRLGQHSYEKDVSLHGYLGPYLHLITPCDGPVVSTPDARVIFCLLMALECEAEAKEVTRRKH